MARCYLTWVEIALDGAFDLIEEFRAPFADRLVLWMNGRCLRPEIGAHGFLRTRIRRLLAQGFARS